MIDAQGVRRYAVINARQQQKTPLQSIRNAEVKEEEVKEKEVAAMVMEGEVVEVV